MGKADQLAKRILQEETRGATGNRVRFEVPREVPVGALQPDGVAHVVASQALAELHAPWCRLRREATLDVKMPGDHMGRPALARGELRRYARWVRHLEQDPAPEDPDPRDFGTWLVGPYVPRWLRADAARKRLTLDLVAPGCWQVSPRDHDVLWIAANELPLHVELLPLLIARSGRALLEFLEWAAGVKGPAWVAAVIQQLPVDPDIADEYKPVPEDAEAQHRIKAGLLRKMLQFHPEVANEIREQGLEKGLGAVARQFERKLSRKLSHEEHAELIRRLTVLGPERLGDVALDLEEPQLSAWLANRDAK